MEQTFLEKAAHYIYNQHPIAALENVGVILPTRRAVYFFKKALARCADRNFVAPQVIPIDDWVAQHSQVEVTDNVTLLFELYEVFKQVDTRITFERFLQWGSVLLRDFDQLDQYLIDPDYLFDYITEAKAIERWRADWPNSHVNPQNDRLKDYFELFANLRQVYGLFRARLEARGLAYRGMAYRQLAVDPLERVLADTPHQTAITKYYFVGFNALTASEEKILKVLVKAQKAQLLWDTDAYYMRDNPYVEGGKLLRSYRDAGWVGEWLWMEHHLAQLPKQLHSYGVPNASMQVKVAGELHRQWLAQGHGGTEERPVAIVLADENLLIPMINALDEGIEDLNITMGLVLRNSLLFTLIDSLFELQLTVAEFKTKDGRALKIRKYNHRTVQKVLNHPFVRRYEQLALQPEAPGAPTVVQRILREIQQGNLVYLDPSQLLAWADHHPLFMALFGRWEDKPTAIIATFFALIDQLRLVYQDTKNAIETEYLYLFYTLLKQLESTLASENVEKLSIRTFKGFLYELIRQTRIPFSGEPLSSLQLLGMLETRALDFERVIILSLNEGVFPTTKRQNSLIPWDIAREAGLPVYSEQDALLSYQFYRLLQRASEVHMVYVTDPNTYNGGEQSRFLLQVKHELQPEYPQNIQYYEHTVQFKNPAADSSLSPTGKLDDWQVPKSEETLDFIKQQLRERGLYATHFSQYLRCSLQYYFNRVAGVSEDEEVEERMDAAAFGSWLHEVLEQIDQQYLMQGKAVSDVQAKQLLAEAFRNKFGGYDAESGVNRLLYQVAEQTLLSFLTHQRTHVPTLEVLGNERLLSTTLEVVLPDEVLTVKIAGKIDRIELLEGVLRVADYKTGRIENLGTVKPESAEALLLQSTKFNDEKIRQLWLYQYLIYKEMQQSNGLVLKRRAIRWGEYPVTAGFYSLRNIKRGFIQNPINLSDDQDPLIYILETERLLQKFVADVLLNPTMPFQKTANPETCQYCDFKEICGR